MYTVRGTQRGRWRLFVLHGGRPTFSPLCPLRVSRQWLGMQGRHTPKRRRLHVFHDVSMSGGIELWVPFLYVDGVIGTNATHLSPDGKCNSKNRRRLHVSPDRSGGRGTGVIDPE